MQRDPVSIVVDALTEKGCDPKGGPTRWRAKCPAHDDSKPSFCLDTGTDGRALLTCQAGCGLDDILAALNLARSDLFVPKAKEDGHPETLAEYRYTDEAGAVLFVVERRANKQFPQRRPDGTGGWVWSTKGIRRVLYRLPEVLKAVAEHRAIWVVEGEKDVHSLEVAGQVATTDPGGAGKWRQEHTNTLAGASEVIVVADRDEAGRAHAQAVAKSIAPVAQTVHLLEPIEGKDITDHLSTGHSLDELARIGSWHGGMADPVAPAVLPLDWAAFWAKESETGEWLVEPFIPAGRQVAIYSAAKVGKSLVCLECAAALATGRPVLGRPASEPVHVVYIDMEMTEDDLRERLEDLGYGPEDDLSFLHYYLLADLPPLDTEEGGLVLENIVRFYGAKACFVDTMARVVEGEENSADTYRAFYRHSGRRLKALVVALVRLDHMGKDASRGQRGSSGKDDDVDVVFHLVPGADQQFVLKRTRTRVSWVPDEVVVTRQEEPVLTHRLGVEEYPAGTVGVARDLDELDVPLDATVRMAMDTLRRAGGGRRTVIVLAALKYRKARGYVNEVPPTELTEPRQIQPGELDKRGKTTPETRSDPDRYPSEPEPWGNTSGNAGETPGNGDRGHWETGGSLRNPGNRPPGNEPDEGSGWVREGPEEDWEEEF